MKEYLFNVKCYNPKTNSFYGKRLSVLACNEKDAYIRLIITVYEFLNYKDKLEAIDLITIVER